MCQNEEKNMAILLYVNGICRDLRTIRELIKLGKTSEELAKQLFNCTEDEFLEALNTKTGVKFPEYKRCLERNSKIRKRQKNFGEDETSDGQTEEEEMSKQELAKDARERELLDLKARYEKDIIVHERNFKILTQRKENFVSCQTTLKKEIKECEAEYRALGEKLNNLKNSFSNSVADAEKCDSEMLESRDKILLAQDELQKVQNELEALKAIEIYSDATGLFVSNEDYLPDKQTINEILCELAENENLKDCSFSTVKKLAEIKAAIALVDIVGMKHMLSTEKCTTDIQEALKMVEKSNG